MEIGTGLKTRYERVSSGWALWFDLDLPNVIDLRRAYFTDTPQEFDRRFFSLPPKPCCRT